MSARSRYEVHPAGHTESGEATAKTWFWHKRAGNGEITSGSAGETFTRHDDAVRGIRGDVESTAELLGVRREVAIVLAGPDLTYFDVVGYERSGFPIYEERPLYPAEHEASS